LCQVTRGGQGKAVVPKLRVIQCCYHMSYLNGKISSQKLRRKCLQQQPATATTAFALATLGGATQTGSFLFVSSHPRWPRQGSSAQGKWGWCNCSAIPLADDFGHKQHQCERAVNDVDENKLVPDLIPEAHGQETTPDGCNTR
jgi:hypothetical protein